MQGGNQGRKAKSVDKGESASKPRGLRALRGSANAILTVLLAAGGLITFVAAVGGAIIWVRFYAVQLPADQVLAVMPRSELVASGAIILSIFMLLGVLAVVGVYVFLDKRSPDDDEEPSVSAVVTGLVALVTVECLVVVALATGDDDLPDRLVPGGVVLLFSLMSVILVRWRESLGPRPHSGYPRALDAGRMLGDIVRRFVKKPTAKGRPGSTRLGWWVAVTALAALLAIVPIRLAADEPYLEVGILGLALLISSTAFCWQWLSTGFENPGPPSGVAYDPLSKFERRVARLAIMATAFVGLGVVSLLLGEWWVVITLAAALGLGIVSWRIARRANYVALAWGVAVFVSVPMLGGIAGIARNLFDPQVQPLALIRADDGPAEALQGIYVTETDERVYFATLATDGCTDEIQSGSGRLLWVPRDEVVAMSVGPPQSVQDAGTRALEMFYSLAPAAASQLASSVGAQPDSSDLGRRRRGKPERRLETVGPALRRDFHLGSNVVPLSARENHKVTVRRSDDRADRGTLLLGNVEVGGIRKEGSAAELEKVPMSGDFSFVVPEGAKTGSLTVACGDLATEATLRVARTPDARIKVILEPGSSQVAFDGRSSTDDGGEIRGWRWRMAGQDGGTTRRTARSITPDDGIYRAALRVTDDEGDSGDAAAWIWRVPEPSLPLAERTGLMQVNDSVLERIETLLRGRRPRLVIHGYSTGARLDDQRVAAWVEDTANAIRRRLGFDPAKVLIRKLLVGAECPTRLRNGGPGERVDVFVLTNRASVQLPPGCGAQEL